MPALQYNLHIPRHLCNQPADFTLSKTVQFWICGVIFLALGVFGVLGNIISIFVLVRRLLFYTTIFYFLNHPVCVQVHVHGVLLPLHLPLLGGPDPSHCGPAGGASQLGV